MADVKQMVREYVSEVKANYKTWLKEAKEEVDFCLGYQWKAKDKAKVESEGRPALTFNEIQPLIRLVSGYQRQNRMDMKVIGVEGGDDFVAEIMTLLIKNIISTDYGEYKISQMFQDGIMSSRGWIEGAIRYNEDPVNGKIKLYNGHYYEIFPDPHHRLYDMEDAEFIIKQMRLPKSSLLNLYPDKKNKLKNVVPEKAPDGETLVTTENTETGYATIEDGSAEERDYSPTDKRQLLTLTECHYKKYENRMYTVDELSGDVKNVTDKKLSLSDIKQMTDAIPYLAIVKQRISIPWRVAMSGDTLIEDIISPLWPHVKDFPLVPCIASFTPIGRTPEKIFQGLIKNLKDPQNEINKRYSQLLNNIANAPWVGDSDALTKEGWIELEKFGSSPRGVYKKKPQSDLHREQPIVQAQAYAALVQGGSDALKRISNINMDVFGAGKGASGQALVMREKLSIMAIQDVYDNLRQSRHILGKFFIGMILSSYTPDKVVRVCGNDKIDTRGAEEVLSNFDMREYDVVISEASMSPVMRMAVAEELMAMREAGILPPEIADKEILEASTIPNRKEIAAELDAFHKAQSGQLPPA